MPRCDRTAAAGLRRIVGTRRRYCQVAACTGLGQYYRHRPGEIVLLEGYDVVTRAWVDLAAGVERIARLVVDVDVIPYRAGGRSDVKRKLAERIRVERQRHALVCVNLAEVGGLARLELERLERGEIDLGGCRAAECQHREGIAAGGEIHLLDAERSAACVRPADGPGTFLQVLRPLVRDDADGVPAGLRDIERVAPVAI